MNLGAVMDEVAARLGTITGLRVSAYPPGRVSPPAGIVSYPDEYTYDATYGRGSDRMTLPVVIVVGKVSDRTARDRVAAYVDGSGVSSVKQVLETGAYIACDSVRVTRVEFDSITIAADEYLSAMFDLDITGQGS